MSNLKKITQGSSTVGFAYNQDDETTAVALPDSDIETSLQTLTEKFTAEAVKHGSKSLGTIDYIYDPDGSETGISGKSPDANLPAAVSTSIYNADDEATTFNGASLTYDDDGDLTNDSATGQSFDWNQLGQLSSITGGSMPSTFSYDPSGRRATATFGGTTNTYLYDGDNLIEDTQGSDPTTYLTGGGDGATYQVSDSSGSSSLVTDPIGSTVALAGSSGALSTDYAYSPSGVTAIAGEASSNTIESVGQQADSTGLEYSGSGGYVSSALEMSLGRQFAAAYAPPPGGGGSWSCTNCDDGPGGGGDSADPKASDDDDDSPPASSPGDGDGDYQFEGVVQMVLKGEVNQNDWYDPDDDYVPQPFDDPYLDDPQPFDNPDHFADVPNPGPNLWGDTPGSGGDDTTPEESGPLGLISKFGTGRDALEAALTTASLAKPLRELISPLGKSTTLVGLATFPLTIGTSIAKGEYGDAILLSLSTGLSLAALAVAEEAALPFEVGGVVLYSLDKIENSPLVQGLGARL